MKCDSLSLPKYIDKSEKIFFIYGDEIVLQNNARDYICNFYKKNGFDEKKIITSKDFPNISQIITQNAGGSLFGSRIIVEIIHEGGKIPKDIMDVLSFKNIDNLVFIIRSSISKISKKASWIKQMDQSAMIIECNKLKSFQEKAWLKDQLIFPELEYDKVNQLLGFNISIVTTAKTKNESLALLRELTLPMQK